MKPIEREENFRELLAKCGNVFDNPILVAIAGSAPSNTAADRYMTRVLGWPNELAERVRNATRLKENFPSYWEGVIRSNVRPAYAMFSFVTHPLMARGINYSDALLLDNQRLNHSDRPLLLREFKITNSSSEEVSTIDGRGAERFHFVQSIADDHGISLFDFSYGKNRQNVIGQFPSFLADTNIESPIYLAQMDKGGIVYHIATKKFSIYGKTARQVGKANAKNSEYSDAPFPCFYKVLEICENKNEQCGFYDRIRILVRHEFGPNFSGRPNAGWLTFERVEPVLTNDGLNSGLDICLTIGYLVKSNWRHIQFSPSKQDPCLIAIRRAKSLHGGISDLKGNIPDIPTWGKQVRALHELALKMETYAAKQDKDKRKSCWFLDLEPIAGLTLLQKPPKRLADLFCE